MIDQMRIIPVFVEWIIRILHNTWSVVLNPVENCWVRSTNQQGCSVTLHLLVIAFIQDVDQVDLRFKMGQTIDDV